MNLTQFNSETQKLLSDCMELLNKKGSDYSSETDRLSNFKQISDKVKIDPMKVWAIYFTKHLDAIYKFVSTGRLESEPIEERFKDAINYLILGYMLIKE